MSRPLVFVLRAHEPNAAGGFLVGGDISPHLPPSPNAPPTLTALFFRRTTMTEHDYEKAMKLLVAVEVELRQGNAEDAHCLITEALSLLRVGEYVRDYDYFEMEE
jgi:hypothetical protein